MFTTEGLIFPAWAAPHFIFLELPATTPPSRARPQKGYSDFPSPCGIFPDLLNDPPPRPLNTTCPSRLLPCAPHCSKSFTVECPVQSPSIILDSSLTFTYKSTNTKICPFHLLSVSSSGHLSAPALSPPLTRPLQPLISSHWSLAFGPNPTTSPSTRILFPPIERGTDNTCPKAYSKDKME